MAHPPVVVPAALLLGLCLSVQPACLDWSAAEQRASARGDAAAEVDDGFEGRNTSRADASTPPRDSGRVPQDLPDTSDTGDGALGPDPELDLDGGVDSASADASGPGHDAAGPSIQPRSDGLTLLLHMDESSWAKTPGEVRDSSGTQNHGVAVEQATTSSMGHFGRGGMFNGSAWIDVPDSESLHPSGAFTVSAWFNLSALPSTTGTWPGIVAKRREFGGDCTFTIFATPGNRLSVDVAGEDTRFESQVVLEAMRWYHVALVFEGRLEPAQRVRLYVDGVLDTTALETSDTIPPYPAALTVGNLKGGGNTLVGSVDEVAFWLRALPPTEIAGLLLGPVVP